MDHPDPNTFTVKEILTQIVIPRLDALDQKVELKEEDTDERLVRLEGFRNTVRVVLMGITAILIPLSVPVVSAVVSGRFHG